MSKKVYIFLADGFEDIEVLTVVDLMRRAQIDIKTVSIKNIRDITTSHGIHMQTDLVFKENDFSDAYMLVIPGGMPGTKYLGEYQPLCDLLTNRAKRSQPSVQHRPYLPHWDFLRAEKRPHIHPAWTD